MSRASMLTTLLGTTALAASLALALPGVEIARADDAPAGEAAEFDRFLEQGGRRVMRVPGRSCSDRSAAAPPPGQLTAQRVAQIQRALAARLAAGNRAGKPGEAPQFVPLNNRGYSYNTGQPVFR